MRHRPLAALATAVAVASSLLMPLEARAETFQCPPTVQAQFNKISAFSPDRAEGSIQGLAQVFSPRSLRLLVAQLALAHGGEAVPSEMLAPDSLAYQLGRPMTWTLWNGQPPEPVGKLHLVCEYEGGLMLHKPVNSQIRRCELSTQVIMPAGRRGTADKAKTKGKNSRAQEETAKGAGEAASVRPVASKAVFNCR